MDLSLLVCVCVCVCVRERERESDMGEVYTTYEKTKIQMFYVECLMEKTTCDARDIDGSLVLLKQILQTGYD